MLEYIKNELLSFGIHDVAALPLSMCQTVRQYKLKKSGFESIEDLRVIIFTIPYYTAQGEKNVSSYAVAHDYHLFCNDLFSKLLPSLEKKFPENRFAGFADDSPINERHAAALAGLGILGDNGMLITESYSSYVFLAEIITDLDLRLCGDYEIRRCEGCGNCSAACPRGETGVCLSALTQKKGELSEVERSIIKKYGSAWGCDICQEVCPHTHRAIRNGTIYTNIPFFKEKLLPRVTQSLITSMNDDEFLSRAYSWRKRDIILRNLSILEEKDN